MFLVYLMCVKHSIDKRNMISLSHNFLWTTKRYMKSLICLCPLVQMSKFNKVNENKWQLWDFLPLFLLSMIQLRPKFCVVLRYHLFRIPLARFFALRYHRLLSFHLPLYLPRQTVLVLDRPLSQRDNEIEIVVQVVTLEGLVLEVLFVITAISLWPCDTRL